MGTLVLGWFLIVVGALFVLIGLARAGRETFQGAPAPTAGIRGILGDLARILEAIARLPQWLLMVAVGGYLIYAGQTVLAGQTPWPL